LASVLFADLLFPWQVQQALLVSAPRALPTVLDHP
jgi:hypothetical protein